MNNDMTNEQLNSEKIEHKKALNRERVARCRAKKKQQVQKSAINSYSQISARFNDLISNYSRELGEESFYSAFSKAGYNFANQPQVQNSRLKNISSLPADYSKEEIGEFLRQPYNNERPLRQTSEILKWTAYPYYKNIKTYQDISTYRHYVKPLYLTEEQSKNKDWLREAVLLDKLNKKLRIEEQVHKITGESLSQGKVFYIPRINLDRAHNKINYAFLTQLPTDYCWLIGNNNISGYTVSFNMMYFMQPGTDVNQFGDLFTPFLSDFNDMFVAPKDNKPSTKVVYSAKNDITFYPDNIKKNAVGNPKVFEQNGRWCYYVSLDVSKVWVFEIDDTTVNVASPFSGLMLTYAQQSDYEQAQISLLLNPLIKIFTGEIPYFNDNGSTIEDGIRLSLGAREMFQIFFDNLMRVNNTTGTAFFSAPVNNIKSHDYPESANANEISKSFVQYSTSKSGLAGLIPVGDDVKASQVSASEKIESHFTDCVQRQFEKMMNYLYSSFNLNYEWEFKMFGSIFNESEIRVNAEKDLANGDLSAWFVLSALNGDSWIDKLSQMRVIKSSGLYEMLMPPPTSYTQSNKTIGRPETDGISSDAKEKSQDSGDNENG